MMEDYNYGYYCSLVLRDVERLEELIMTLQKDVEGLMKRMKEGQESVSFLLPLLLKSVEIVSLIPNVQEQLTEYVSLVPPEEDNTNNVNYTMLVEVKEEEEEPEEVQVHVGPIFGDYSDANFYYENIKEEGGDDDSNVINNHSDDEDHGDSNWAVCPENVDEEDSSENDEGDVEYEKNQEIGASLWKKPGKYMKTKRHTMDAKPKIRIKNIDRDKIRHSFNSNLQQKFRGVIVQSQKEDATNSDVTCLICGVYFSIARCGRKNITCHLKTERHLTSLKIKTEEGSLNEDQLLEVSKRFPLKEPTPIPVPILDVIKEVVDQRESKTAEWEATSGNHREYICPQCPEEEKWDHKQRNLLNQHIRYSHPSSFFRHKVIGESEITAVRQYFDSLEKPPFTCPVCKLDHDRKSGLQRHLERSHCVKEDANQKLHECTVCGKILGSKKNLKQHLHLHTDRPLIYSCPECHRKYPSQKARGQHIKSVHGERAFLCSQCGSTFPDKRKLEDHVMGAHQKLKRFKCNQCPEAYPYLTSLLIHKQKAHEGLKFLCNLCGLQLTTKAGLMRHLTSVHENPGTFSCDICTKTYRHERTLVSHRKSHDIKK